MAVRLAERWLAGHVNAETWQASIVPLAPMHAVDETSRTREASRGTGRPWTWRRRPTGASNAGNSSKCMSSLTADSPCYDAAARQTKRGRAVGACTAKQEQARAVQGTRSSSSHPPPGGAGRPGGHPQEPVAAGPQGTVASLLQLRPEHQSICVCCCDPARMVRLCHGRTLAAPGGPGVWRGRDRRRLVSITPLPGAALDVPSSWQPCGSNDRPLWLTSMGGRVLLARGQTRRDGGPRAWDLHKRRVWSVLGQGCREGLSCRGPLGKC